MTRDADETSWTTLRELLIERYDHLRQRLARRLGSTDAAQETLHELYLRMERTDNVGVLQNPSSYLLTCAVNLARDRWRTEDRRSKRIDVDALYEIIDESPGPDRVVEGRLTFEAVGRALDRLTPRQRDIMIAVRFEGLTQPEIAQRLGISSRLVGLELQRALESCQAFLANKN